MKVSKHSNLITQKIKKLSWMFFDIDGVFTDGGLYFSENGEIFKKFNVLDGHGIKQLFNCGINVGLISGRGHAATRLRAKELGIKTLMLNVENKVNAFEDWTKKNNIDPMQCGHMGDDIPDLELFSKVGFSASVPNACDEIQLAADWVSKRNGGNGAVRELCDLIVEIHE
ncbi:MAG: hypothetical protein CBC01_04600 [Betaproteobacteria bacterium TMED41]|nr:MAG: hypothetical protein CBC01_04600 [Betaproteobacteria bacterium TMED41]|tara:strand:+ start:1540 stop:2049 length:510 start_codon:yes stop_codon:yes gene_type:complete